MKHLFCALCLTSFFTYSLHALNAELPISAPAPATQEDSTIVPADQIPSIPAGPETTFALIKPDAVAAHNSGKIIDLLEANGFTIVRMEKKQLSQKEAEQFYAVHKARPFYKDLVSYMTSGPVIALVLEKDNAIKDWRELMGATNSAEAKVGTIRKMFGIDKSANAVHGSDSPAAATTEIGLFFPELILNLEEAPTEPELSEELVQPETTAEETAEVAQEEV